nr:MAG TPA: hypothetical protein [Caudoviricetes sp.]
MILRENLKIISRQNLKQRTAIMIKNTLILPLLLLKAYITPKVHGPARNLSLSTGRSRLSVICSVF